MHRRDFLILTASVGAAAAPALAGAETTSLNSFDIAAETKGILRTASIEIQPTLARIGLVSFASRFRAARMRANSFGYEDKEPFKTISLQYIRALASALLPKSGLVPETFAVLREPGHDFLATAYEAYKKNLYKSLVSVLSKTKEVDPVLETLSDVQIVRYQLTISLLGFEWFHEIWATAQKQTCVYPFC